MSKKNSSIHNPQYKAIINELIKIRKERHILQSEVAKALGFIQPDISKIERYERRLDILELFDYINFLGDGNKKEIEKYWIRIRECYKENHHI